MPSARQKRGLPGSTGAHDSLMHAAAELCKIRRVPFVRFNQRPVKTAKGWRHPGADAGVWDALARLPLGVLFLDAKTGKAILSPDQLAFRRTWEGPGVAFAVFHDVQELQTILTRFGAVGFADQYDRGLEGTASEQGGVARLETPGGDGSR